MTSKVYSFLGLAAKAGRLITGEDACERAVKSEKADLVIVAEDASQNTKKKFSDMCSFRNVDIRFYGEKEFLGKYTGKEIRAVIAVSDRGFAERLKSLIDGCGLENGGGLIGKD